MTGDPLLVLQLLAAALTAGLGAWLLALARREPERQPPVELAGVGPVSPVTMLVAGLALLGVAYHVVVYALGITGFRAPIPVALGVAVGAVLLSLLADRLENSGR